MEKKWMKMETRKIRALDEKTNSMSIVDIEVEVEMTAAEIILAKKKTSRKSNVDLLSANEEELPDDDFLLVKEEVKL